MPTDKDCNTACIISVVYIYIYIYKMGKDYMFKKKITDLNKLHFYFKSKCIMIG